MLNIFRASLMIFVVVSGEDYLMPRNFFRQGVRVTVVAYTDILKF